MSFAKVLLGVFVGSGILEGSSQAAQQPHSAQQHQSAPKPSGQLTAVEQALLDQIRAKIKANIVQISCKNPGGKPVNVDLKKLSQDIQTQKVKIQKSSSRYILRYDSNQVDCPHSVFMK